MKIQIHGKQLDVGDTLRSHVDTQLSATVNKYSARPIEAIVTFSKDRHEFVCDAIVHLSTGLTTQASAHANDVYESFDGALDRMETQLRRYKRRLKNHHLSRTEPVGRTVAANYVISTDNTDSDESDSLQPVIIAETSTTIPSLSVGEAVMQMELAHGNLLVFRNDAHGRVNVVYRRDDGNIGWLDPDSQK
jgi:ribosomal subunit interface protein